jgi:alkylation response protein AidB-like acyl-CoA dehydrogenase
VELRFESLTNILPEIRRRADSLDRSGDWPAEDLLALAGIGAGKWFVPVQFGGEEIDPLELHLRYEAIASASLATALIVSQRDSAVGLIDGGENAELRAQILPALASGEIFSTIGIAQLTTSRQGGLRAIADGNDYRLEGVIPWSTGAAKSQYIVAGAVMDDGRQILFLLPTDLPGVLIHPPMEIVALRSSWTTRIELKAVRLEKRWMLRSPAARALAGRSKGIPLGQTFLAFGLCRAALSLIAEEGSDRARSLHDRFSEQFHSLRNEIVELCRSGDEAKAASDGARLRAACNELAVRVTQSSVALYKGSALLAGHPAQRLAREAMFFLVWSCPDPIVDCTVNMLVNRESR